MRLLGNYLQEGPEGSFQEVAKYQNVQIPVAKDQVKGSFSETTFRRALKVVSGKWQRQGTYHVSLVVNNLATIEVDSSTSDVDSTSLQLEEKLQLEGKLLGSYL